MHAPSLPGTPLTAASFWPTFGLCHTPPSSASCRHCFPSSLPLWRSPSLFFLPIFSFHDLPQFVPICKLCEASKVTWESDGVCAYLRGALSLFLLCSMCVCLCVCSGEMGHRGGGHLAGTAESGGVQRNLHPTRHPRLGATAPGEEGPEGTHTHLLTRLNPSVNLCGPSSLNPQSALSLCLLWHSLTC